MTPDADRPWARRLLALITRTWFLVIAAVVVVLAVAYTLAGFFLVPRLIISYVPRYVQEQLKRRGENREGRGNPPPFKRGIKPFRLQAAGGPPPPAPHPPFVSFARSRVLWRGGAFSAVPPAAP